MGVFIRHLISPTKFAKGNRKFYNDSRGAYYMKKKKRKEIRMKKKRKMIKKPITEVSTKSIRKLNIGFY